MEILVAILYAVMSLCAFVLIIAVAKATPKPYTKFFLTTLFMVLIGSAFSALDIDHKTYIDDTIRLLGLDALMTVILVFHLRFVLPKKGSH